MKMVGIAALILAGAIGADGNNLIPLPWLVCVNLREQEPVMVGFFVDPVLAREEAQRVRKEGFERTTFSPYTVTRFYRPEKIQEVTVWEWTPVGEPRCAPAEELN